MNPNFGRKSPVTTGMYENLPAPRSCPSRRQVFHPNNNDVKRIGAADREPNPPRRRLNEAGQSTLLTGINHSRKNKSYSTASDFDSERSSDKILDASREMPLGAANHSGGVSRFTRAKSEKREVVDSGWYMQSFSDAGGPIQNNVSEDGCANQSEDDCGDEATSLNNGISVAQRKRMFETTMTRNAENTTCSTVAPPPPRRELSPSSHFTSDRILQTHQQQQRQQLPYRGSKTTPNVSSTASDEWDFLATLNDILRRENFLGEEDLDFGKGASINNYDNMPGTDYNQKGSFMPMGFNKHDSTNRSEREDISTTPTSPMSPRPPRPSRMRAERRKEYARTRSLDAGQFSLTNGLITASNNNNNHELVGSNSNLLSGSNIDLSTGGNDIITAGSGSFGGYTGYRQNQPHSSSTSISNRDIAPYLFPGWPLPSPPPPSSTTCSSAINSNNNVTTSIIVENPFHPSNNLSVLPVFSSPSLLEHHHGRQTLVSPVKSSSTGIDIGGDGSNNNASASKHFPHFITNEYNGPPPPRNSITNMPHAGLPGERCITPRQQQQLPLHRLTTDFSNHPALSTSFYNNQQQQQQQAAYRLPRSPLLNTVSSSLDSIYERLKANEYLDPIGPARPLTQVYFDRNFEYLHYGMNSHAGGGAGSGLDACSNGGGGHNSQPNLFGTSNGNGCGVESRNFHNVHQNASSSGASGGNGNVVSCTSSRVGRMSPFQSTQMMENVSPSMRLDKSAATATQFPQGNLSRCGTLGGSLSNLPGVVVPSNSPANNGYIGNNITAGGSHSAFPSNSSNINAATSWWNLPGDYRGRSYGSFKVI